MKKPLYYKQISLTAGVPDLLRPERKAESKMQKEFLIKLKCLYGVEQKLMELFGALVPTEIVELKEIIQCYREEGQIQIGRLQEIFNQFGQEPISKRDVCFEDLVGDFNAIRFNGPNAESCGEKIITVVQKTGTFKIASYDDIKKCRLLIGQQEIIQLLTLSLDEEKAKNIWISAIARIWNF